MMASIIMYVDKIKRLIRCKRIIDVMSFLSKVAIFVFSTIDIYYLFIYLFHKMSGYATKKAWAYIILNRASKDKAPTHMGAWTIHAQLLLTLLELCSYP